MQQCGEQIAAKEEIIMHIAIARGLLLGAIVLLPSAASAQFAEKKVLTLEIARKVVAAAEAEAARNHLAGVVAVVDDGGSSAWTMQPISPASNLPPARLERRRCSRSRARRLRTQSTRGALLP
jgi:hypothetical protein